MTQFGASANSVAVYGDLVAVAIEAEEVDAAGMVVFFTPAGELIGSVEVGFLPDMLTFSPDGTKVLTANEGQPNDDYTVDPEGSVSVIDLAGGMEAATVTTIGFADFNADGPRAAELPPRYAFSGRTPPSPRTSNRNISPFRRTAPPRS
ncbi:hypothetical protein HC928_25745 [bacterium]|nr:hypothetical protein [bacterium]